MKKYLCILLAVLMLLTTLIGCDGLLFEQDWLDDIKDLDKVEDKDDDRDEDETSKRPNRTDSMSDQTTEASTQSWFDNIFGGITNSSQETQEPITEPAPIDPATLALNNINVDWSGEDFYVLAREDFFPDEWYTENRTEVLEDAVYQRNLMFEEFCNLNLETVFVPTAEINAMVKSDVHGGYGDFSLIQNHMALTFALASEGYLTSFTNLPGMDLTAPWWDQGTANFMIMDKIYSLNSAINYSDEDTTYVMLFNKQMAAEGSIDPYELVYNNEWTLDMFQSLIRDVSLDLDCDGKFTEADTYGFVATWETASTFFYGADLCYVACEAGTDPYLALDETAMGKDKALGVMDSILSIYYINNATYMSPPGMENLGRDVFRDRRGLFYSEVLMYVMPLGKEMENDFGILPVPKYNNEQENYITWTNAICSTSSISKVAKDPDRLGPTLEALAILSYQKVTPAYYDTILQRRTAYDEESRDMLDLIFATRTYDLSMYFSNIGLEPLFKTAVNDNVNNFSSNYAKKSRTAQKAIDKLIISFAKEE